MTGLSFLNPMMLAGLLALAVPVVIHLISRFRAKRIDFSTVRFLEQVKTEATRMERLKHLLLLALRVLLAAFMVLAFSRPFFSDKAGKWSSTGPKAAAIIIDNSYSMQYENALSAAKKEAFKALGGLKAGDLVTVLSVSDEALAILPLTTDHTSAKAAIENIKQSYGATDFSGAVKLAEDLLSDAEASKKQLFLATDNQDAGWNGYDFKEKLKPGTEFKLLQASDVSGRNAAITGAGFTYTGAGYTCDGGSANIMNFSPENITTVVKLTVDGKAREKTLNIPAGQPATAEFELDLPMDEPHTGWFELSADGVPADNKRYFALNKLPELSVLLVCGRNPGKDAFYLLKALAPLDNKSRFKTKAINQAGAEKEKLSDYAAVLLVNPGALSRGFKDELLKYIKAGGGLAVFPGEASEKSLGDTLSGILPAEVKELASVSGTGISIEDPDSEIVKGISDPKFSDWASLKAWKYYSLSSSANSPLSFDEGGPAVLTYEQGEGKAVVFTTSADGEWNNLPLTPVFLPLIHRTMEYLAGKKQENLSCTAGAWFTGRGTGGEYLPVINGAKNTGKADAPGVYSLKRGKTELFAAVNVKAQEEGNLLYADKIDVELKLNNPANAIAGESGRYLYWSKKEAEDKQRWWWWLMLAALEVSTLEVYVANHGKIK